MKVAAAIQNAIQGYCVIYDKKKRAITQTSLVIFFKRIDRIEFSKESESVSLTSEVSEIGACPLSPISDNPSALSSSLLLLLLLSCFSCVRLCATT